MTVSSKDKRISIIMLQLYYNTKSAYYNNDKFKNAS